MLDYKNILVPTDFSDNSIQALELAQILSKFNNASLHVMYVLEPAHISFGIDESFHKDRHAQSRLLAAEEEMRRFINKTSLKEINIVEIVLLGKPNEQILCYAHQKKIDLIIMASHGWTGLTNLLTGSVTNKVMRYTDIPMICIKANKLVLQKGPDSDKSSCAENWVG
jgi:nucleotide-binding universal stress UspA family protein